MQNRPRNPVPAAAGSPLDQVRAAFDRLTGGPNPVTVDGREVPGMPARPVRLDEVRDKLRERGCPGATRDAVWALLVHRARIEGQAWTIACIGCALPDLTQASRQLSRGLPDTPPTPGPARPIGRARSAVAGVPDYLPDLSNGTGGARRWGALDATANAPTVRGGHPACRQVPVPRPRSGGPVRGIVRLGVGRRGHRGGQDPAARVPARRRSAARARRRRAAVSRTTL
jgi:hypothetical protein